MPRAKKVAEEAVTPEVVETPEATTEEVAAPEELRYELDQVSIDLLQSMYWDPVFFYKFGTVKGENGKVLALILKFRYDDENGVFQVIARKMSNDVKASDDKDPDFIATKTFSVNEIGDILVKCMEQDYTCDYHDAVKGCIEEIRQQILAVEENGVKPYIEISSNDRNKTTKGKDIKQELVDGVIYDGSNNIIATFRNIECAVGCPDVSYPFTYSHSMPQVRVNGSIPKFIIVNKELFQSAAGNYALNGVKIKFTPRKAPDTWDDYSLVVSGVTINYTIATTGAPIGAVTKFDKADFLLMDKPSTADPASIVDIPSFDESQTEDAAPRSRFSAVVKTNSLNNFIKAEIERVAKDNASEMTEAVAQQPQTGRFGRILK